MLFMDFLEAGAHEFRPKAVLPLNSQARENGGIYMESSPFSRAW